MNGYTNYALYKSQQTASGILAAVKNHSYNKIPIN